MLGLRKQERKNKMLVYTSESSSRFGTIKYLVDCFNDCKLEDVKIEMQKDLNMWLNRYKKYNDELSKGKIEKIKKEIDSLREIDEKDFQKEQDILLLTNIVEVSKEDYDEMFEILQPLQFGQNYFIMAEFFTESYTSQFFKKDGKFYHKMIDYRRKETWAQL